MKQILGRKQTSSNAKWLYAVEHIEELITRHEVETYADWAVERIKSAIAGKNAAFAWSGGKDSIVLGSLCERAGLRRGYFTYCTLDYPAFLNWCMEHKPDGVVPIDTGYDLDWLAKHEDMIFAEGQLGQRWRILNQTNQFTRMFEDNHLDVLLMGHRIIDGNVCGKDFYIRKKSGETRYSPIADWSHELVLGYIHYNGLDLPPCYGWKDGFVQGTHAWPEREFCKTLEQGYREICEIDRSIVERAAEKLPSAAAFLKGVCA